MVGRVSDEGEDQNGEAVKKLLTAAPAALCHLLKECNSMRHRMSVLKSKGGGMSVHRLGRRETAWR